MSTLLTDQIRAFLNEKRFAVLATINADGTPQQSTMWYLLDDDTIIMNTKAGRIKDRNMRRDQRVSLCIEAEYNYLTLVGRVELIEDQKIAQHDIYRLAVRYQGEAEAQAWMANQFAKEQRVTIRIKIERVINNL